jgi:hypothetical protein
MSELAGEIYSNLKRTNKTYDEELNAKPSLIPFIPVDDHISISPGRGPISSECKFDEWVLVDSKANFWMHKDHAK